MSMIDLAERCEKATGPDRGLDAEIELETGNWTKEHSDAWWHFQECGAAVNPPMHEPTPPQRYTASLDAAITLVRSPINGSYASDILRSAMGRLSDCFSLHMRLWPADHNYAEWLARYVTAAALRAIKSIEVYHG